MTLEEWQLRTNAALSWIRRSIQATKNGGSAHSWHPLLGWAKAYPETTGYLLETIMAYSREKSDESLQTLAIKTGAWLDTVQLPSGAFPGLLEGNTRPSVFNTSQILFATPWLKHPEKAVQWLMSILEPDGAWRQAAFVPGFVPSYYTRAVWGVLQANAWLQMPGVQDKMRASMEFYLSRFLPNGAVRNWGFRPGRPAFTHTIAYTLEGFWECAQIFDMQSVMENVKDSLRQLLQQREKARGRTAGRYDELWRGDLSFVCITGNCQLSILCHKIGQQSADPFWHQASESLLQEILPFQYLGANKNRFGALPASAPIWGAYLPFRYPNWTVKFFLDAMLRQKPAAKHQ